jgi:hypothetical protein
MKNSKELTQKDTTAGDAAVDGLLAGGGAGLLMAAYLIVAGLAMGETAAVVLGRFDPAQGGAPVVGALAHLAMSGVYGVIFGLGTRIVPRRWRGRVPGWLAGPVFGLTLFGVAAAILLPSTGSPLGEIPAVHLAVAHVLYGLALGLLLRKS